MAGVSEWSGQPEYLHRVHYTLGKGKPYRDINPAHYQFSKGRP